MTKGYNPKQPHQQNRAHKTIGNKSEEPSISETTQNITAHKEYEYYSENISRGQTPKNQMGPSESGKKGGDSNISVRVSPLHRVIGGPASL